MSERPLLVDADHTAHHQPHRAGHRVAVLHELGVGLYRHLADVRDYALHEVVSGLQRDVSTCCDVEESGGKRRGCSLTLQHLGQLLDVLPSDLGIRRLVDQIIDSSAEGVHDGGVVLLRARQEE